MASSTGLNGSWKSSIVLLLYLIQQILAYRPVQHCKTLGENGHYSACAAITQYYNVTTGMSDMYLRYHWYRYRNSKNGWHAFAMGEQMAGAYMVLMYGDPNTPSLPMTVDIRTAEGHAPPLLISEMPRFKGLGPQVELVTAVFEKYEGEIKIESLNEKPTHVGICEVIIRGYEKWKIAKASNTSVGMDMIWSSNYKQDMQDDFSHGRAIDMHAFGLGFGFLYVDILNAVVPEPMFGPIDELGGLKGVGEHKAPPAPTPEELATGESYIVEQLAQMKQNQPTKIDTPPVPTTTAKPPVATGQAENEQNGDKTPVEQPAGTILGKTLRDWMWHLHGLLMILAFLVLYPAGTYLIRSGNTAAFNQHWTVQSLATVSLAIGSLIGYINSYGISVKHQYIGILLTVAVAVQIVLGWRHHVQYVTTKTKGWLSKSHIILGRIVLPLGWINIILGMLLRRYGWFTITLVVVLIGLETVSLAYVLFRASRSGGNTNSARTGIPPMGDEAEEYFQLDGEDDFSDSDGEHDEARTGKEQERREQAERLRRLDKV